jgi:hypothetical protein
MFKKMKYFVCILKKFSILYHNHINDNVIITVANENQGFSNTLDHRYNFII